MRRNRHYRTFWRELVAMHGSLCYYCGEEVATTIDHVVPYSHDQDNSIENLVPACALCNVLAGDKIFEYVEEKRQYILTRRAGRIQRRAICTNCLLPFSYRVHSPSLFLCAECYDMEYETNYAERGQWAQWIRELHAADIYPEAHRHAVNLFKGHNKKNSMMFRLAIADGYEEMGEL